MKLGKNDKLKSTQVILSKYHLDWVKIMVFYYQPTFWSEIFILYCISLLQESYPIVQNIYGHIAESTEKRNKNIHILL